MNDFTFTTDVLLMILPLLVIQISLIIYCVVKILREGVQNLNKWGWLLICIFGSFIGSIIFLIVGRKKEH